MAHILVIDDDALLREVLRLGLERFGHQVSEARDGRSGLAVQQARPVDLVITDILMPGMEGLETILELRRHYPQVKIIAISGGGLGRAGDYLTMAAKFGAHRVVSKPFSMTRLAELVTELLEESPEQMIQGR
ncbi:MAG TPA: response regulator [Lacunisphaera sp.]|jgi:DNA-binding NtrC family response regulator|nr:response regulator [Lacunisphaera sp.]